MKTIELTQGKVTVVDDDVYEWASKFKWYAQKQGQNFYANRHSSQKLGKRFTIQLHREIMHPDESLDVDHKNGDGLNNLRENLRVVTFQQNSMAHRRLKVGKSSKFRGVRQVNKKWRADIEFNQKCFYLGTFEIEEDAAVAYDKAALEKFGEFAQLNFSDAKQAA